jgi:hypothetical protein
MIRAIKEFVARATLLAVVAACAAQARGQASLRESFDGPEPTWRDAGGDARYRVELHERSSEGARSGGGCERFRIAAAGGGNAIYLSHEVGRAPIIPELRPTVWIRSNRPGIQILARVIFPRTVDPRTGQPVSTLLVGNSSTQEGTWEQLYLENLPTQLAAQARVLRAQLKSDVDTREAYLDRILLNAYRGPGTTELWIDDLEIAGQVMPATSPSLRNVSASTAVPSNSPEAIGAGARRPVVELSGAVLLTDGRPFFPRMIEHRGENLEFLRRLGFNAIKLDRPPSTEMLAEATRLGLWLVSPPVQSPVLNSAAGYSSSPEIGSAFNPVLAWDLGQRLSGEDLEVTKRWAEQVRRSEGEVARPIVCAPDAELRKYSRYVDILSTYRYPVATSFELSDYSTWLRERPRLARPGTPAWTCVQTQLAAEVDQQWNVLSPIPVPQSVVSSEQLRLLAYTGLAAGTRGVCFQSRTRLDAADASTHARALNLELLNLELELAEPWGAAGSFVANVPGHNYVPPPLPGAKALKIPGQKYLSSAISLNPEVNAAVLRTDRARLLLPIWTSRGAQFVPGQSAGNSLSFIVPGVSESTDVYEITPGGLRPLRHSRVTGGIRVTLDEFSLSSMIVMTQDPLVINTLVRRLEQCGRRVAEIQRELTARKLQRLVEIDSQLTALSHPVDKSAKLLSTARDNLQTCDQHISGSDFTGAFLEARRAMRPMNLLERAHWEQAVKPLGSPTSSPFAVCLDTLPQHWQFMAGVQAAKLGRNRLAEGNFEDLNRMMYAGWRHFKHTQDGVRTTADLSDNGPHAGRTSLKLAAKPVGESIPGLVETPPVWITSPSIPARVGQWYRIHAWVRVPVAVTGSLDGLMIVDSFAGEALAERIGESGAWKEVTMYRAAPADGPLSVTFALTGFGEAWIDDVTIEPYLPPGAPPEQLPLPSMDRSAMTRLPSVR